MNSFHKLHHLFRKTTMIGCLSLSLTTSCLFAGTVIAGPADDASLTTQPAGPGQSGPGQSDSGQSGTSEQPAPVVYANPHYYDLSLANPVVNPVDKYSYDQMEQDINKLTSLYGNRMTVNVIGQSLDGRNIYDIVVGNPSASKKILFQGAIHAREYITVPLMMQQLEYLLANYDNGYFHDKSVSGMFNNVAFHFVPMANPDGVSISQFGENALRSDMLRQLVQACYALDAAEGRTSYSYEQYLSRWKSNGRGVDLNHNFDAGWAELNPTLTHYSSTDYKGESPLSEPESQALANLANQDNFSAIINYHAMGNVIYWDTLGNKKTEQSLQLAQIVSANNGYQILSSKGVGGYKDWLQRRENPVAGITIELGRSTAPVSFFEYPAIWEQNKAVPGLITEYVLSH